MIQLFQKSAYSKSDFDDIVTDYRDLVYRTCMGVLHNEHDAADITQDVFLKVYEGIDQFRNQAQLKTWLYRIALNQSLNYLKKMRIRRADQIDQAVSLNHDSDLKPDQTFMQGEIKNALQQALGKLPQNQQKAFILNKYNDLSYKEIAEVMDLSVSSVESLLHRAKKNMHQLLIHFYKENFE